MDISLWSYEGEPSSPHWSEFWIPASVYAFAVAVVLWV